MLAHSTERLFASLRRPPPCCGQHHAISRQASVLSTKWLKSSSWSWSSSSRICRFVMPAELFYTGHTEYVAIAGAGMRPVRVVLWVCGDGMDGRTKPLQRCMVASNWRTIAWDPLRLMLGAVAVFSTRVCIDVRKMRV